MIQHLGECLVQNKYYIMEGLLFLLHLIRQSWHSQGTCEKVMRAVCQGPPGDTILTLKKETQNFLTLIFSTVPCLKSFCLGVQLEAGGPQCWLNDVTEDPDSLVSLLIPLPHTVFFQAAVWLQHSQPSCYSSNLRNRETAPSCVSVGTRQVFPSAAWQTPIPAALARTMSHGLPWTN